MIGSLFETSPLGREMTMNLARHVTEGYNATEPPSIRLLQNSVLHFVPITGGFSKTFQQFSMNPDICDPLATEELADQILSPENDLKKDLLLKMLEVEHFHLILTFSAGGFEVQYPMPQKRDSIFADMAVKINEQRLREAPKECALNAMQSHQDNTIERIANLFLNEIKSPLFNIQLDCCKMPPNKEIATVWRRNIHKTLNFLKLTETGVKGSVKDRNGQALREAIVSVKGHLLSVPVTKNMAYFRIVLPAGEYELEINSPHVATHTLTISLQEGQILDLGSITLQTDSQSSNTVKQALSGSINGLVLDYNNRAISNAKVSLVSSKTIVSNVTDESGKYQLYGVPFGSVLLRADALFYVAANK